MKKLILIVLLIFGSVVRVYAKSYYSEYGDFNEYSETYVENSDEVFTESKKVYRVISINKELVPYDDYSKELTDEDVEVIYGDYVYDIEDLDPSKRYEVISTYTYNKLKDYKYIIFHNGGTTTGIKSIELYDDRDNHLIRTFGPFNLQPNDYYINTLFGDEVIPVSELSVHLNVSTIDPYNIEIYLDEDGDPFKGMEKIGTFSVINRFYPVYDSFENNDILFNDEELTGTIEEVESGRILSEDNAYRNYEIISYNEEENLIPLDIYSDKVEDNQILDTNDSKELYRYKKRDKVEIKDNIVIDNYDFKLEDAITYFSIPLEDIKVVSNIDITKNGKYNITYLLPFKEVNDTITVDIKENYINLIKAEEVIIQNLENKVEESVYKVEKKNQEIKEVISTYESEADELSKEVESYKKIVTEKEDVDTSIKEKKNLKRTIGIIGLIILLLSFISLCIFFKKEFNGEE